jgi:pSer/pThr/pTyr-binding forkhead associated (FHA) protein
LSGKHAAIFYRGEGFEIADEKSMNGTYVDGKSVPLSGQPLGNYAQFQTGATVWRFILVDPMVEKASMPQ